MTKFPRASKLMLVGYDAHCSFVRRRERRPVLQRFLQEDAAAFRTSISQGEKFTLGSSSNVVRISNGFFLGVVIATGGLCGWGCFSSRKVV